MTSASLKPSAAPARRTVVAAAGAAGLAVALTACGSSDDSSSSSTGSGTSGTTGSTGSSEAASTGGTGGGDNAAAGAALTTTADIPEGGGKVFESEKVVVTQPTAGTYKAFSAVCTHQGCAVKSVADGVINCPCHNSNFSIEDGSVKSGPAQKALPSVSITVSGTNITLA